MKFHCEGQEYDSDEMLAPPIHDPYVVAVFITKDYACVFATFMNHDSGVVVLPIKGSALELLAERTKSPELIEAVRVEKENSKAA
jgi:hypothetical protein